MKHENDSSLTTADILEVAGQSNANQECLLNWLDRLLDNAIDSYPIISPPLDPEQFCLVYTGDAIILSQAPPGNEEMGLRCPAEQRMETIGLILAGLTCQPQFTKSLPPKLRRLLMWSRSSRRSSPSKSPRLPAVVLADTSVFYEHCWQYFRQGQFRIERGYRSILTIGTEYTERLGPKSGRVLSKIEGKCIQDSRQNLYRLDDSGIALIRNNGDPIWTTVLPYVAITNRVLSTPAHTVVGDEEYTFCLDTKTGALLWSERMPAYSQYLEGTRLYQLLFGETIRVGMRKLPNPSWQPLLNVKTHLAKHWWSDSNLMFCTRATPGALCNQLHRLDLKTYEHLTCALPTGEPLDALSTRETQLVLFETNASLLLCEWSLDSKHPKLRKLRTEPEGTKLIYANDYRLILVSQSLRLEVLNRQTLEPLWQRHFLDGTFEQLCESKVVQNIVIVPAAPPTLFDLESGKQIGQIKEALYQFAKPILPSDRDMLLADAFGYVGKFSVSGYLSSAVSDA